MSTEFMAGHQVAPGAPPTAPPLSVSVIVPVYNQEVLLRDCLAAIVASTRRPADVIVVDDASTDASAAVAASFGAVVLHTTRRLGPAHARNLGASAARGDLLAFFDSDVVVRPDTLALILEAFLTQPALAALFGSYNASPAVRTPVSLYRNLLHHYVHQGAAVRAATFWAGCGAVRREVYLRLGGMNEAFDHPSIEDIEFGYRLAQAGHPCELRKNIQVTHLKQWTIIGTLRSDLVDRAIPWTLLILSSRTAPADLNLTHRNRLSALVALVMTASSFAALPAASHLAIIGFLGSAWSWLNAGLLRLLFRCGGMRLAAAGWVLHFLHNLNSALGFGLGLALHVTARLRGARRHFRSRLQEPAQPRTSS